MKNIHIWAYWIYINDEKILLIKKARWPYKWMYDLPWGGIEENEKILDCLSREIFEETWMNLIKSIFIWINEYICSYENSSKVTKNSHHIWFYYWIEIFWDNIKSVPDGEDSLWSEFIEISKLDTIEISPIAKPMIEKYLKDGM